MNIKEQESQLSLNLNLQIMLTLLFWLAVVSYMAYSLWGLRSLPEAPLVIGSNVPTIKQSNIDILQTSIKDISGSNLPVTRPEPFD